MLLLLLLEQKMARPLYRRGIQAFLANCDMAMMTTKLLAVAANNDRQVPRLLNAIGRGDLLEDPRFADTRARNANAEAFKAELAAALIADTADSWEQRLAEADVPAGRPHRARPDGGRGSAGRRGCR